MGGCQCLVRAGRAASAFAGRAAGGWVGDVDGEDERRGLAVHGLSLSFHCRFAPLGTAQTCRDVLRLPEHAAEGYRPHGLSGAGPDNMDYIPTRWP